MQIQTMNMLLNFSLVAATLMLIIVSVLALKTYFTGCGLKRAIQIMDAEQAAANTANIFINTNTQTNES